MPSETAIRRYRALYSLLLRLYPRRFRERFAAPMAQTFHDLCRERIATNRSLLSLALWAFIETSGGVFMENIMHGAQMPKTMLRVALGALAAVMVPLVASRLIPDWNWPPQAFVVVYFLFFALGMAYALIARRMGTWSYKAAVGLALAASFALGWGNMVHVADSGNPANLWYYSVLVVGIIGAAIARLRARGLAITLFAMAATLALIALCVPTGAPPELARNMTIGNIAGVVIFTACGLLFRHASQVGANPNEILPPA